MTKILVVGANGFLGRNIVQMASALGWQTDALIHNRYDQDNRMIDKAFRMSDLLQNRGAVYDYIFNTAAYIPYGHYNKTSEQLLSSNYELPIKLYQLFPDSKMIFSSSVSVYGENHKNISETSAIIAPSAYGVSKLAGEDVTKLHAKYAVIRFSSLYGKGMYPCTFLPRVVNDAMQKKQITLYGDGSRLQNYLHISDAAKLCINAALYGNNEIYLGTDVREYTNKEIADTAAAYTGAQIAYTGSDNAPSHTYDNAYTQSILKFTPAVNISQGIKDLLDE